MKGHKQLIHLVIVMICVSVVVAGITMYLLYQAAFREEELRLTEAAQSQARLIETIAFYDKAYNKDFPGGPVQSTLEQLSIAHRKYEGFGETGVFLLARRDGDMIHFLLRHRHTGIDYPKPIAYSSNHFEPINRALSGKSGVMKAVDYGMRRVLAAYEPVSSLNWGIVSKIQLAEIRAPFIRAGLIAAVLCFMVVFLGAVLFMKVSEPIMRTLRQRASELEELNARMHKEIEDRRKAEEHIHQLSHELIRAQETERQMISRELHDRVAQDLASFNYKFFSLINSMQPEPEADHRVRELSEILDESITTIRDLTYNLRSPVLEEIGLIQAVYEYCHEFSAFTGIDVDFQSGGMENLNLSIPEIQINLYRLIQEGLTNIRKHADAKAVNVRLSSAYPYIILRIEDNGRGFDVEEWLKTRSSAKSLGIRSMQERVRLLQGDIKLQSKPMHGTRISIKIPIEKVKNDPKENNLFN